MLGYSSTYNPQQPYTQPQRAAMLSGLRMHRPYAGYGQNQQDILNAAADMNAADLNLQATKANSDLALQKAQSEQQLALAGLTQMSSAQQDQNRIVNQQYGNMSGILNPLLGGLFA